MVLSPLLPVAAHAGMCNTYSYCEPTTGYCTSFQYEHFCYQETSGVCCNVTQQQCVSMSECP